jgi:DMSO reductase family type II enzyme heme b subunit
MKSNTHPAAWVIAAAVALSGAAFAQTPGADKPVTVKTAKLAKALSEKDLDDPSWQRVPAREIALTTAFPGHPSIVGTSRVAKITVQAAKTAEGVLLRLKWRDATADAAKDVGRFADGAAIEFPLDRKASTLPFMGGGGKMVNIWYWSAAKNAAENMVADGFGTATRLPTQDVRANGRHAGGEWTVVFFRAYRTTEKAAIRLAAAGGPTPVAFAVWEGSNQERDGLKAVTLAWQNLAF